MPSTPAPPTLWNSLEVAKLVASVLTPAAVAFFGMWLNRYLKRIEHFQWANQKAVEKRLEVELAPLLNDIYCYFDYIGDWKWKDPKEAIALKRSMDRLFYVNAALFSDHFKTLYHDFINLYFISGPLNEYDASAKMRTDIKIRKQLVTKSGNIWDPAWDALFSQAGEIACREDVVRSYSNLMDAFAAELGVELK